MTLACGIDVGGTKIAGGVVDEDGPIIEELRVESPATDAEAIEEAIAGLVDRAALAPRHRDRRRRGGGLRRQGPRGRALRAQRRLAQRGPQGRARAARRAAGRHRERRQRRRLGRVPLRRRHDAEDLLLVTVGTGVGGGLVLDGEVYRGANGVGAEIGHMRVVPNGILCGCGKHGCFEQYASGSALVREARVARDERCR